MYDVDKSESMYAWKFSTITLSEKLLLRGGRLLKEWENERNNSKDKKHRQKIMRESLKMHQTCTHNSL